MTKKTVIWLSSIFLVSTLNFGCTKNKNKANTSRLKLGFLHSVQTLNPYKTTGMSSWNTVRFLFEPLFKEAKNGELKPVLGLKYKIDRDKKEIFIELRKNVKFHNGEKLTNKNIKFTYESFLNKSYEADLWRPLYEDLNVSKIELIGEYKLRVFFSKMTFESSLNFLTKLRAFPKKFYNLKNKSKWHSTLIGTGPYKLKSFKTNESLKLSKNNNWWGDASKLKIDELKVVFIRDITLAFQMVDSDELDIFPINSFLSFLKIKKNKLNFVKNEKDGSYQVFLSFNIRKDIFTGQMRKAISHLINYNFINNKIFEGKLKRSLDMFDPDLPDYPKGEPLKFDVELANKILEKEGWRDLDKDGIREKNLNGKLRRLSFEILADTYEEELIAGLIQEELKKNGIQVSIGTTVRSTGSYKLLREGKFDSFLSTSSLYKGSSASSFSSDYFYNFFGYKNQDVDALIEKLKVTFDLEKRNKIVSDIILKVRKDSIIAPLFYNKGSYYLLSKKTKINASDPLNPLYWDKSKYIKF